MADEFEQIGSFLSRWSRRKLDKDRVPVPSASAAAASPASEAPAPGDAQAAAAAQTPSAGTPDAPPPETLLPPVEGLTPDSDFTPFMRPEVDAGLKSAALKRLFKDPRFNVMDGLDTYVDDYSVADPIPDAMMKTMYQAREHLWSEEEKALADAIDAAEAERESEAEALVRELDALEGPSAQGDAGRDPGQGAAPQSAAAGRPAIESGDA